MGGGGVMEVRSEWARAAASMRRVVAQCSGRKAWGKRGCFGFCWGKVVLLSLLLTVPRLEMLTQSGRFMERTKPISSLIVIEDNGYSMFKITYIIASISEPYQAVLGSSRLSTVYSTEQYENTKQPLILSFSSHQPLCACACED